MYLIFSLFDYFNGCRLLWVSPCWTSGFCYFFFSKECYEMNASVPQDLYIEILSSNLRIWGRGLWELIRSWKLSLYEWAFMVMISTDLGCILKWPWTQNPPISACWFLVLQREPLHQKYTGFCCFFSGRDWTWNWCLNEASENLFALSFMWEYTRGFQLHGMGLAKASNPLVL